MEKNVIMVINMVVLIVLYKWVTIVLIFLDIHLNVKDVLKIVYNVKLIDYVKYVKMDIF